MSEQRNSGLDGELLKGLVGLVPHILRPSSHVPVTVRVEVPPGPIAEQLKKAARALSERTRLPSGVETLKLAKPGAAEEFLAVCAKAGIDVDEIKERLRSATPRGPMIPAEQLIQLSRRVMRQAEKK